MIRILPFLLFLTFPALAGEIQIDAPAVVLNDIPFTVTVTGLGNVPAAFRIEPGGEIGTISRDGDRAVIEDITVSGSGDVEFIVEALNGNVAATQFPVMPGWISLLPPLIAIGMALIFRQVVPALFLGVWAGAWAVTGFSMEGLLSGLLDSFQVYALGAVADYDHAAIILFTMMIGGMVGIISSNGGMKGIVEFIVRLGATTARRGQLATASMGMMIFFDDYANSLIVGNTMRPITDKLKISREKLAYIVDSTAAPLACIAVITTWVGYEIGLIEGVLPATEGLDEPAFSIFLNSILYNFYPILALLFVFLVANSGRDFGPMLAAERQSRGGGELPEMHRKMTAGPGQFDTGPDDGKPHLARLALVPIGVLILTVLIGLYVTGGGGTFREMLANFDAYKSLMWGSLMGVVAALSLTIGYRVLSIADSLQAWTEGTKSMVLALAILVLAWSLSSITHVLHTADYLVSILGDTLPLVLVPILVFVIAAATGFATGTSWGAMGILVPLVVPLTWAIMEVNGMQGPEGMHILYSSVACILGGAVWGDHCSPISDTTVLSSMASGCDHVAHVRTQLPYALFVGAVAMLAGTLPAAFGAPWWLLLVIGAAILIVGLRILGGKSE